jgi:hypothetical protein
MIRRLAIAKGVTEYAVTTVKSKYLLRGLEKHLKRTP